MRRSLSHGLGFLEIDHRESPGLTPQDVAHVADAVAVAGGELYETDVYQCSHCQRTVVLRAARERMAARGYCPKCDHHVCNACEALRVRTGQCVPFKAVIDRAMNTMEKFAGQPDHPDAVMDPAKLQTVVPSVTVPEGPRIVLTDV